MAISSNQGGSVHILNNKFYQVINVRFCQVVTLGFMQSVTIGFDKSEPYHFLTNAVFQTITIDNRRSVLNVNN